MPAEKMLALGQEPTVADEAQHPPGVFPKGTQEVGHYRFERPQGPKGLVADAVFELVPQLFDRV